MSHLGTIAFGVALGAVYLLLKDAFRRERR